MGRHLSFRDFCLPGYIFFSHASIFPPRLTGNSLIIGREIGLLAMFLRAVNLFGSTDLTQNGKRFLFGTLVSIDLDRMLWLQNPGFPGFIEKQPVRPTASSADHLILFLWVGDLHFCIASLTVVNFTQINQSPPSSRTWFWKSNLVLLHGFYSSSLMISSMPSAKEFGLISNISAQCCWLHSFPSSNMASWSIVMGNFSEPCSTLTNGLVRATG